MDAIFEQELFLKTIKQRGFLVKLSLQQLMQRAKIYEYDHLCHRFEEMMVQFVEQNCQLSLASFIINNLLQTEHELTIVEQGLLSIWATV
jgi:hypothetical protein